MSEWYEPESEDISFDKESKQVDIFVKQNDFGRVYITLTFDQIKKIHEEIESQK